MQAAGPFPWRFAESLTDGIRVAELIVFEDCAQAPIYQDVDGFNQLIDPCLSAEARRRRRTLRLSKPPASITSVAPVTSTPSAIIGGA